MPDPKIITTHAERLAFWLDKLELAGQATISAYSAALAGAFVDADLEPRANGWQP